MSGKTQGGGRLLIRYPLPNAAATSQALSDVWHDFFQIVLMFALRLGSHLLGSTLRLGSTLAGEPFYWAVVWAGKPPCLGRLRVGGLLIRYPLPNAAVLNTQALSDGWYDLDCVACRFLPLMMCLNTLSLLLHSGWEATCWEAFWLGSHLLGNTLAGKPAAGKHLGCGVVVWAGKPPCLGRLSVGGIIHQVLRCDLAQCCGI